MKKLFSIFFALALFWSGNVWADFTIGYLATPTYVRIQQTAQNSSNFKVNIYGKCNYDPSQTGSLVSLSSVSMTSATAIRGSHTYSFSSGSSNYYLYTMDCANSSYVYLDPYSKSYPLAGTLNFTWNSVEDGTPIYSVSVSNARGVYNSQTNCTGGSLAASLLPVLAYDYQGNSLTLTDYYKLTVVSGDPSKGSVSGDGSASGGQYYGAGTSHSNLSATSTSVGYHFSQWQKNGANFSGNTANPLTVTLNANDTYTANFALNTYTVVFNANGGTGSMSNQAFTYGTAQNLTSNSTSITRSGYTFAGWATTAARANDGIVDYTNGQSVNNLTTTHTGTVNLYAVWEEIPVSGTYHTITLAAGANGTVTVYNNTKGKYVSFTDNKADILEYDNITITYSAAAGYHVGTHTYSGEGTFNSGAGFEIEGPHTITVTFEPDVYTITYRDKNNGEFTGTHGANYPTTHTYGTATALVNPTKAGATFLGWYTSSDCSSDAITSLGATAYTSAPTVYAKWINNGTITGVPDDALHGSVSVSPSGNQAGGTAVTLTASPLYDYQFIKWVEDGNTSNPRTVYVDGNATYTAEFGRVMQINISNAQCVDATSQNPAWFQYVAEDDDWRVLIAVYSNTFGGSYTESDCALANCKIIDKAENETIMVSTISATTWSAGDGIRRMDASIMGDDGKRYHVVLGAPQASGASYDNGTDIDLTYTSCSVQTSRPDLYDGVLSISNNYTRYLKAQKDEGGYTYSLWLEIYTGSGGSIPTGVYPITATNSIGNALAQHTINDGLGVPTLIGGTSLTKYNGAWNDVYFWMIRSGSIAIVNTSGTYFAEVNAINTNGKKVHAIIGTKPNMTVTATGDHGTVTLSAPTYANQTGTGTYQYGTRVTLTPVAATGYAFAGWTGTDVAEIREKDGVFSVKVGVKNLDVTPVFVATSPMHTVTIADCSHGTVTVYYDYGENEYTTGSSFTSGSQEIAEGSITVTAVAATGYTLTSLDYSGEEIASGNELVLEEDRTITAVFSPKTYTVNLDNQSATTAGQASVTATYDAAMPSIASNLPAKTGHAFGGYWTNTGGTGTKYYNADGTSAANWTIDVNPSTLYAQWNVNSHTLTWVANGGSLEGGTAAGSVAYGTSLTAPTGSKTGYTLTSWSPEVPATMPDADATYTAQWTANTYYVRFNKNNGDATGTMSNQEFTYDEAQALTANGFTLAGHTFAGWATASDGAVVYSNGQSVSNLAASGTVDLYAKWNVNSHTLTWNANGGSLEGGTAAGSVAYGTALTAPTGSKTGYTLTGWSPEVPATMPDEDVTCTAQWTANTYSLTLDKGTGGTANGSATATYNSGTLTSVTDATKDGGWTLLGYFTETTGGTKVINANGTLVASVDGYTDAEGKWIRTEGSMTLYAQWSQEEVNIDLYDNAAPKVNSVETDNEALLAAYGGRPVNVTLHHSFTANLWNTLCLPFDYELSGHEVLDGNVYDMSNCTTSPENGMVLTFSSVDHIDAGKPYLVWTESNSISSVQFENVTLSTFTPDTIHSQSGHVDFRAVMETTYIKDKTSIYIGSGNRLYYANASANGGQGTRVRGYRAYFQIINLNGMEYTPARVRIMIEGKDSPVLTTEDVEEVPTRKYVKDGILIIERGGVRYDAQGKKID